MGDKVIGICCGVMVTPETLEKIRPCIPAHIEFPQGKGPTCLVTIQNKLWDGPMVLIGVCELVDDTCQASCWRPEKMALWAECCRKSLRPLVPLIEQHEEDGEYDDVDAWWGVFESVEKLAPR